MWTKSKNLKKWENREKGKEEAGKSKEGRGN